MSLMYVDYRVRQRDHLIRLLKAMVSRLNLRAVLRMTLEGAVEMLYGSVGLVALRQPDGSFTFAATYGLPPATAEAFRPLLEGIRYREGRLLIPPELMEEVARETGLLLRQMVALPLVVEGKLLGVIFVFRPHSTRFTPDDEAILGVFADYAAIAVYNANLYEAVNTERLRLNALLEVSADGIMILGPDLRVERFNAAFASLTGWPSEEAQGHPYDEVVVWARRTSPQTLRRLVEAGWPPDHPSLYVEGDLRRRNGSLVSVGITYAPLLTRKGSLLNVIAVARDISHFREADKLKETFISIVSHELKTPVAIIRGYAETLQRPQAQRDPALVEEMLSAIVEETDRLARLVDDLLDASRLQAGGLPLKEIGEVDLAAIARRVVERYRGQTRKHTLRLELPDNFPLIRGDARRLEQVLDNLVSNAIKYSPRGGEIVVRGEVRPAEVVIAVQDEGVGIPLEEQDNIFQRFYRVEGPETRAVAGTGLGLYLTRAIVQAHGGRIWVKSAPGKGSTFYVALPRQTEIVALDEAAKNPPPMTSSPR